MDAMSIRNQEWGGCLIHSRPDFLGVVMTSAGQRVMSALTPKEREVLFNLSLGMNNREIAETMHISYQVAKNYIRRIFDKTGTSTRIELLIFAFYHSLSVCPCRQCRHDEARKRLTTQMGE